MMENKEKLIVFYKHYSYYCHLIRCGRVESNLVENAYVSVRVLRISKRNFLAEKKSIRLQIRKKENTCYFSKKIDSFSLCLLYNSIPQNPKNSKVPTTNLIAPILVETRSTDFWTDTCCVYDMMGLRTIFSRTEQCNNL